MEHPQKPKLDVHALRMLDFPRADSRPLPSVSPVFSLFRVTHIVADTVCPRHQHLEEAEILVVDKGVYRCRINNVPLMLKPGELVVVKPGDWHSDVYEKGLRFFGVHFRLDMELPDRTASGFFHAGISARDQKLRIDRKVFWPLFTRIQKETQNRSPFAAKVQDTLIQEFFWRLLGAFPPEIIHPQLVQLSKEYRFRSSLNDLFQQHLQVRLSVREMAKQLNMSESSLAHRCKAILAASPMHLFIRHKIEKAQIMLKTTSFSIKEISACLGFEDPLHFSKVFKRTTGYPPTACR